MATVDRDDTMIDNRDRSRIDDEDHAATTIADAGDDATILHIFTSSPLLACGPARPPWHWIGPYMTVGHIGADDDDVNDNKLT